MAGVSRIAVKYFTDTIDPRSVVIAGPERLLYVFDGINPQTVDLILCENFRGRIRIERNSLE
jgi:hypothetical protein